MKHKVKGRIWCLNLDFFVKKLANMPKLLIMMTFNVDSGAGDPNPVESM